MRHSQTRVGILLLDAQLLPLYYNAEAGKILSYPHAQEQAPSLQNLLSADRSAAPGPPATLPPSMAFTSGRRQYVCRTFQLDSVSSGDRARFVVMLERDIATEFEVKRWSERFQLTNRESETVAFLLKGLSSKEIAQEMRISPSTVKAFLKLAMVKVGVSNRSGLVAKILRASCLVISVAGSTGVRVDRLQPPAGTPSTSRPHSTSFVHRS